MTTPFTLAGVEAAALERYVRDVCAAKKLDAPLVCAMIEQESRWNPWAWNPEPQYKYVVNWQTGQPFRSLTPAERASEVPPHDFPFPRGADRDTEFWGQQASFGLLQLMGGAARERGFRGLFLTELCDPVVGVEWGLAQWIHKLKVAKNEIERALLIWNGGGNPNYPAEVLARVPRYRT